MPDGQIHLFDNLYPSTSGYNVKWVDEVRIYRGGYRGESGTLVKSLADTNTAAESTTPLKSPLSVMGALGSIALAVSTACWGQRR
jgi:hypothetical protein